MTNSQRVLMFVLCFVVGVSGGQLYKHIKRHNRVPDDHVTSLTNDTGHIIVSGSNNVYAGVELFPASSDIFELGSWEPEPIKDIYIHLKHCSNALIHLIHVDKTNYYRIKGMENVPGRVTDD